MSVINAVREFIKGNCPLLEEFDDLFPVVNLDKLPEKPTSYSIESVPSEPIVKRYMNGDSIRKVTFYLCSRCIYSEEANADTSDFYEKFSEWLEKCNEQKRFPKLDGGKRPQKFVVNTGGYVEDATGTLAQYQIQCEFRYFKPKEQRR